MPPMPDQAPSSSAIAHSVSSSSSDGNSNDSPQPQAPPRVYDLYSWQQRSPSARLVYIQNVDTANLAISQLKAKVLGFDLEWRPNFVKGYPENPVALVQLASEDTILLVHLTFMSRFPEKLKELLLDPDVAKAGVGIQKDCKKLYTDYGVDTRNCVDLSLLARTVDNQRWKGKYANPIGLSRLLETYEEHSLSKGKVQISNWEQSLDLRQQHYAANDSHAGLVLYERLAAMTITMNPVPERFYYTFDTICGLLYAPSSGTLWTPYNPYYDPGPPPPPRIPKTGENEQNHGHGFERSARGGRFRDQRTEPQRPLSPTASSFVPGAKTHSPSPSPSPRPGLSARGGIRPPPHSQFSHTHAHAPRQERPIPAYYTEQDNGFPALPRTTPRQAWPQAPRARPPFHNNLRGTGGHPRGQPVGRGRGRGRGYPMVAAPTG